MLKNPNYVYGSKDLDIPGHLNFSEYILKKLSRHKDKVAMINAATNETITYREIVQQSINFAVSLARMGIKRGHTVALCSENRQEYWSALIGVASTGATVTPISNSYGEGEFINAINISKPKHIICSPSVFKQHEGVLRAYKLRTILFGTDDIPGYAFSFNKLAIEVHNVSYDQFEPVEVNGQTDTLFIVYSSGTTGMPKGVMLTHANVIVNCCLPLSHDPSISTLTVSPWYHVMGLIGFLIGLASGRTGIYIPKFDVDLYLKTIEKYKVGQLSLVPPVLIAAFKATSQYDLSSVRLIYSGAAPLHKETLQAVFEKFPNCQAVSQGYGASETTMSVTRFKIEDVHIAQRKPGSVGSVVPTTTVKVVDIDTREPLGPNQQGEICVRGPILMKGYVGIGRGDYFDDQGFYKTGDVGYYDEEGFFYIADRLKELIKYKGYQVPPAELEALLLTHPAVNDVGVIGIPDTSSGEVPLAFVVKKGTVSEEELKKFVAERLSNPKHLRGGVRFVSQIPKSPSGKILRKELKKMAEGKSKL